MVHRVAFWLVQLSVNVNELASTWLHFLLYPVAVGDYYSGAITLVLYLLHYVCVLSFDACIGLQLQISCRNWINASA